MLSFGEFERRLRDLADAPEDSMIFILEDIKEVIDEAEKEFPLKLVPPLTILEQLKNLKTEKEISPLIIQNALNDIITWYLKWFVFEEESR